ncbi:hypothetical protein MY8738_006409 [Beauveria namnaoensis]
MCIGGRETGTSNGSDRAFVSGSVPSNGVQETGTLAESASSHSVVQTYEIDPTSDYSTVSPRLIRPIIAKFLSGLTKILLKHSDYSSNAIQTAWEGNRETSSLLALWDKAARNDKSGVTSAIMVTKKITMQSVGEAKYIEWLGKIMAGFLSADMAGLLILTAIGNSFYNFTEVDRLSESSFEDCLKIDWADLRSKLSYLRGRLRGDWVKVASDVFERKTIGELLAAQRDPELDLSLYSASDNDLKEWKDLVAALDRLPVDEEPQPTGAAERQTPPSRQGTASCSPSYNTGHILNTRHECTSPHTTSEYRRDSSSIPEEPDASAEVLCPAQPDLNPATTDGSGIYHSQTEKTLHDALDQAPSSRPRFDPVRDASSPCHNEDSVFNNNDNNTPRGHHAPSGPAASFDAARTFDQFALENPTAQTELFAVRLSPRGPSYQTCPSSQAPGQLSLADPAPGASVQRIIMPDVSAHDQMLSYRAVRDLNALASAASQTCPLRHDGDSGYGGSAMSSQFSMATSAMPVPFGDRETTGLCSRSVSLCGPERPNNVPARLIGGHRTALPDKAPLPAAATGSNSTTRHLPVLDSTSDKAAADNPPVGINRRPHTAGQKRSAESEGSDHRLSRKRHNPPTMDAEHEHNTDLHSPVPESTHLNDSIWELGASSEHQTDRTLAIEETPGLGVFASSRTAYNDNRDNGESNASKDFSALVSVDSFATVPNAPVEVDHTHYVSNVQTYGVGWGPLDWADSSGQQAEPDFTLCPADLDLATQNMQSYGVSWGPLDWADSSGQQAEPEFTLCPADLDLATQNMQSYGVSWGPLDWADSSGQQAEPDFTLCPADLDLATQNMQSYGVGWCSKSSVGDGGQQAVPDVFEPNLTGSDTGENAQS